MDIPSTGRQGNILAIFIPGVFTLFNIGFAAYFIFTFDIASTEDSLIQAVTKSNALVVVVSLLLSCFAYLLGVLLRLFRSEIPDNVSAWYLRHVNRKFRKRGYGFTKEKFPYIKHLGLVVKKRFPKEAQTYYTQYWKGREDDGKNRAFFNFVKSILLAIDTKAASELYAAEALNRYIAGMFFGLLISMFCIGAAIISEVLSGGEALWKLVVLEVVYVSIIVLIIKHYRFIRIKEVETLFAVAFAHRHDEAFSDEA